MKNKKLTEVEILNDPRFIAMQRGHRAQSLAVTKALAAIVGDEMGSEARSLFLRMVEKHRPNFMSTD